ncbi:LytR/AlgR family response regulator transcription factor [Ottowia sp.]|uniref:LytR/AlgR family response regulator transcription factor n=1 Tax=Ottowia sp. TaxID=1898956 RepID=UPI0039E5943E
MTLQVLIVDDEPLARSRLRTLLADCRAPAALAAAEAGSAAQAMALVQHQRFDVALLDIHMPGADGLQLAAALRAAPEPPLVVFVTAHAEHAVHAFEVEAVDYLTKPVRLERLQAALQKVERLARAQPAREADSAQEWLLISERGRTLRVPLAEVLYLKAELKYVTVRTAEASHLLDGSLSQLEDKYPARFLRIHRNALVARHAIRALVRQHDAEEGEGWAVRLAGVDEVLMVSRRQVAAVREALGE